MPTTFFSAMELESGLTFLNLEPNYLVLIKYDFRIGAIVKGGTKTN